MSALILVSMKNNEDFRASGNLPQSAKRISHRVSGISHFASAKYITRRKPYITHTPQACIIK